MMVIISLFLLLDVLLVMRLWLYSGVFWWMNDSGMNLEMLL